MESAFLWLFYKWKGLTSTYIQVYRFRSLKDGNQAEYWFLTSEPVLAGRNSF